MADFFRYLMIGLGNGAIYAMIGLGLVVIYRSSGLLNFAHGELAMFNTWLVWQFCQWGVPMWAALFIGVVLGSLVGMITQKIVIEPMGDPHQKPLAVVIVTIGLFLGFNALAQLIWTTETVPFPAFFGGGSVRIFDVAVSWEKVGALGILGVEALVMYFVFTRTRIGLALRAVASNLESAALVGIPVNRTLLWGWGMASSLGALAGVFTASARFGLDSNLMQAALIYTFAAITLGGFDSLIGAVVGGLIVGIASEVVPVYISAVQKMKLLPAFILILLVLLIRPQGLFGAHRVDRV